MRAGPDEEPYLEHFAEGSVPQLPDDFPNVLRVDVSVHILVLLFLLVGPQLENLAKIEERHAAGRGPQGGGDGSLLGDFRRENAAPPPLRGSNNRPNDAVRRCNAHKQHCQAAAALIKTSPSSSWSRSHRG